MSPARATALLPVLVAVLLSVLLSVLLYPGTAASADATGDRADAPGAGKAETGAAVHRSWTARILIRTQARQSPGYGARKEALLRTRSAWSGGPHQFLVLAQRWVDGKRWLKLRLPSRPNNSAAWVPASRTRLVRNPWRVVVTIENRRVAVFRDGSLRLDFRAVVGAPDTPTPRGLFAIYERVRQPDPDGFLGPFALHLTAHSRVLDDYGGGPGRVAIHGRGGASLYDALGTARSHGCIRVGSGRVVALARLLPLGTPVLVR